MCCIHKFDWYCTSRWYCTLLTKRKKHDLQLEIHRTNLISPCKKCFKCPMGIKLQKKRQENDDDDDDDDDDDEQEEENGND